ncbi:biotin/lipoyl-binding protein, partial [Serratia ureilytica]
MQIVNVKKSGVVIALIGAIIIIFLLILHDQTPPETKYVTAPVRHGDIEDAVLATGRLDAVERVNVGARVSGEVKSLKVKLGDRVTKGQPIADIDDLQQRNDLRNAEAALNVVKANMLAKQALLKQAESRFKRQRR